ncbi:MAG: hypothetical protein U0470_01010 [Anaerolineae bacterium]
MTDGRGAPIARFGRFGRGPGELRSATDIAVGPDGRVWIADRGNRRVVVYAPASPSTPPPGASGTAPAAPSATPAGEGAARVVACPGQPAVLMIDVDLPPVAPRLDLVLLFDTTGSMEAVVSTARDRALDMAARLRDLAPDVAVAVADVRDMPYGAAGQATDWPWRLRGALSTDPADLAAAAGELWAGGGGDEPEAYSLALRELADDERVGWRPGARRVIALFGDSVPRDEDLDAGVAGATVPAPWTPGLRCAGATAAPTGRPTRPTISTGSPSSRTCATAASRSSSASPARRRRRCAAGRTCWTAYWRDWAGRAAPGGGAVEMAAASQLPDALATLVAGTGRRIERAGRRRRAAGALAVGDVGTRRAHRRSTPGRRRAADVRGAHRAAPQTPDGTFDLTLYVTGDGRATPRGPSAYMARRVRPAVAAGVSELDGVRRGDGPAAGADAHRRAHGDIDGDDHRDADRAALADAVGDTVHRAHLPADPRTLLLRSIPPPDRPGRSGDRHLVVHDGRQAGVGDRGGAAVRRPDQPAARSGGGGHVRQRGPRRPTADQQPPARPREPRRPGDRCRDAPGPGDRRGTGGAAPGCAPGHGRSWSC